MIITTLNVLHNAMAVTIHSHRKTAANLDNKSFESKIFEGLKKSPLQIIPIQLQPLSKTHPSSLSQELLDDFFTEADDHLLNIRQALLGLENSGPETAPDSKLIGDLFHNFHSFKGISAIAGLEPAEALAHATEDLLRFMRSGEVRAGEDILNVLSAATHKLEQIVAAFRAKKPLPGYESLLADIKRQCPAPSGFGRRIAPPAPAETCAKPG